LRHELFKETPGADISEPFRLGKLSFLQKRIAEFGIAIRLKEKLGVAAS
jgi:hypothetical protein